MTHLQGGTLDHFITTIDSDILLGSIVINDCFTDHVCLLACSNIWSDSTPIGQKTITYRKFKHIDMVSLKSNLASPELLLNPCLESCADLYTQYHTRFSSLLDRYAPFCSKKVTSPKKKWLIADFFQARRLKRYLELTGGGITLRQIDQSFVVR